MSGCLYMVGTPIGNLGDMSPRVAEAFRAADAICCEDTRVTSKLLAHLGISKTLIRCDENVIVQRAPELVDRLLAGETLAFASDAGMPSVSDPGQVLVDAARDAGVEVQVIPGPSACVTALVASGISCEHFFFEGFLPRKHGERVRRLGELACVPGALLFYESPHRAAASLQAIAQVFPKRRVALCRELTKLHEEFFRGSVTECLAWLEAQPPRGEFCIVIAQGEDDVQEETQADDPLDEVKTLIAQGMDKKVALAQVAKARKVPKRELYNRLLAEE